MDSWILGAVLALLAVAATIGWLLRRNRDADLGYVSNQWVSERRLSQPPDSSNNR